MEAKMKEENLADKNTALDKINRMKNELMENLTHELRTPLAVISSFAQLAVRAVRQNDITEQTVDDLELIISEAHRLADMSSGVLQAFRDNKTSVDMIAFDMKAVIEQVSRLANPIIKKNRNRLSIEIDGGLPLVFGRVYECTQIIWNLLSNAAAHTNDGTIVIHAASEIENDKPMLTVTVSDDGAGISDEMLLRVFERNVSGTKGGAGIGLPICKEIVQEHGGTITIQNGEVSGVIVRFTLPFANDGGIL
jgi:signal transduction histidine kinase